ncbi:lysM and putative peptidoglycan-binding domain-containing protein 3-like [Dreissena polymorpha]|uniref:LysM domain-containing protein n=1 Tax=Dreissena polymorpha TaxID=45954 RepID=A0A9D4QUT6_DREPO|nr:lysM and putative peptidoglycan-binding domain-containing protein 3-like [Dreissena polymorpha]KAH3843512.1 hypothetical protein DPMN_117031 [Dreissena polymorpha]
MSAKSKTSLFGYKSYQYTRLGDSLGQVQNVKAGSVYVFGTDDIAEDESDDIVEFAMEPINRRKGGRQVDRGDHVGPLFVERKLGEEESLQSLSLQYGCPIAELKRINNLIRDQDFHALTTIKIPVKKHSFLIDKIKEDSENITDPLKTTASLSNGALCSDSGDESSVQYESETQTDLSDPDTQKEVIRKISIKNQQKGSSREAQNFLQKMDSDIAQIVRSARTERNSLDEVISVLTNKSVHPLMAREKPKSFIDYSFFQRRWKLIVCLCVVLLVIVPITISLLKFYHAW